MIGSLPNPVPTLKEGLALGAPVHIGFVRMWNWIVDFFRTADQRIVTELNGRTGRVSIVAGNGVEVITTGNTITVGLGTGKSTDTDNPNDDDRNGGGAGGEDAHGVWENETPDETSGGSMGGGMFQWNSGTMGVGGVMVGRTWVTATGTGGGKGDALYSLAVTIGASPSAAVVTTASLGQVPSGNTSYIPIYEISGGQIVADYRGAFVVPCWET